MRGGDCTAHCHLESAAPPSKGHGGCDSQLRAYGHAPARMGLAVSSWLCFLSPRGGRQSAYASTLGPSAWPCNHIIVFGSVYIRLQSKMQTLWRLMVRDICVGLPA